MAYKVSRLDEEVLNDQIDCRISVLDSGNWDVADLGEDTWQDDILQIFQKMWLESWLAIIILTKVGEEVREAVTEASVHRILLELVTEGLQFVENTISVVAVL